MAKVLLRWGLLGWIGSSLVGASLSFSCGGQGNDTSRANASVTTGAFAEPCIEGNECQDDLICARSGIAEGLCSQLCDLDSQCQVLFGAATRCEASACVLGCQTHDDCPASSRCDSLGGACRMPLPEELDPSLAPNGNPQANEGRVDKIDLLFMIDNTIMMADKQRLLAEALPDLVGRLVDPRCLNGAGAEVPKQGETCPEGSVREFQPINDIHVGVITSSLGGFGSEQNCNDAARGQVDVAHLLGSLPRGQGTNETSASNPFLSWCVGAALENGKCPPSVESGTTESETSGNVNRFVSAFQFQVVQAGENGCGFEASLEAWYRFLIEPNPWTGIVRQPCSANETSVEPLCVGPIAVDANGAPLPLVQGGVQATDAILLEQRKAFLRPDSLLAIVMLTDENDCSFNPTGQSWRLSTTTTRIATGNLSRQYAFRATAACEVNSNDICCYSCGLTPREGCPTEVSALGDTVNAGCSIRTYEGGDEQTPTDDPANLRCFDQKRRFGVDYLFPVARYVNALKQQTICVGRDDLSLEGCPTAPVPNPLFRDLKFDAGEKAEPAPVRGSDLVFLVGIVGVPWQDVAVLSDDGAPVAPLRYRTADSIDWGLILGDNASGRYQPRDPLMREQIDPRIGTHPITGQAVAGPDSSYQANAINGHEWNILTRDDLQYACTFELAEPVDCATVASLTACDCSSVAYGEARFANPLCQNPAGGYGQVQYFNKAYPSIRVLEVLKGYGNNSIVTSICPRDPINKAAVDYGYRPAMAALLERIKGRF